MGIDINLASKHEWLFSPLQFISGLGPIKAKYLIKSLVRSKIVSTRKDLLSHGLRDKVYVNAVGFLKILGNRKTAIDLLDGTRIHPESYDLVYKLVTDAYFKDYQDINDDNVLDRAMKYVKENHHLLRSLEMRKANSLHCDVDIVHELIQCFQDWRKQFAELSIDEPFLACNCFAIPDLYHSQSLYIYNFTRPQKMACQPLQSITNK